MIRRLIKNSDHKRLLENFLSLSSLQLIGLVLPLLTLPYILRIIGMERYGVIVVSWSLINYFVSITDFSFRITATRDVAIFKNSRRKLNIIYSKVVILQTLLQIFSFISIICIVYLYRPFHDERLVFWLTIPYLLGNTIFPDWFFQGIEKMKYITFINLGVKIFFTLCVFIFIKNKEDYWIYPLLQSLGFVGAGLAGQMILINKYKIKFVWIKRRSLLQALKSNTPIFVNQFLPTLYNNSGTFLLGIFANNSLVGVYDAIKKIINLESTLISMVSRVFFPFLNRNKDSFPKYRSLMMSLGLILSLLPVLFYKLILWYLHIQYENAFLIVVILSSGIFFLALYDIYGLNYFIVRRMDKVVMRNTIVSSLIGFILAFPLISYFNITGAAINLTFARLLMGGGLLLQFYSYRRKL